MHQGQFLVLLMVLSASIQALFSARSDLSAFKAIQKMNPDDDEKIDLPDDNPEEVEEEDASDPENDLILDEDTEGIFYDPRKHH